MLIALVQGSNKNAHAAVTCSALEAMLNTLEQGTSYQYASLINNNVALIKQYKTL